VRSRLCLGCSGADNEISLCSKLCFDLLRNRCHFFEQLIAAPVPLDLRAIRALTQSPLALDLYVWAARRVSYLKRPTLISGEALRGSFGAGYADTP